MGKFIEMEASVNISFDAEIAGQKADSVKKKTSDEESEEKDHE